VILEAAPVGLQEYGHSKTAIPAVATRFSARLAIVLGGLVVLIAAAGALPAGRLAPVTGISRSR
jgi:cytochrome bd-type quinol oxidase subunit 1